MLRLALGIPLGLGVGLATGALGGGGSVLAVPLLVLVLGQAPADAATASLVVVGGAALVGAVAHGRAGRVRLGTGLAFGACGAAGSVAGSALSRRVDGDLLLAAFAAVVLAVAAAMLRSGEARPARRSALLVPLAASAVGVLTGLFGVGGGFLVVPALVLLLGLPMREAVGTSLVVIVVNAVVALVARLVQDGLGDALAQPAVVAFAVAALVGALAGRLVADRASGPALRRAFAALLVAVALVTGARGIVGLVG